MRLILLNSAIMPVEGVYELHEIGFHAFCETIKQYKDNIMSYIGYPQNVELIKRWTGVDVGLNREAITGFKEDDIILVMRLIYRVKNPSDKGKIVNEDDFKFYLVKYRSL